MDTACVTTESHLTIVLSPPQQLGRWYIQEGWLMVVPTKGEEVKRKMFFLFSDILIATKPCHPLHPLNSDKFSCQAVYPLNQCTVDKVFGHTQSQGGLLSVSFSQFLAAAPTALISAPCPQTHPDLK